MSPIDEEGTETEGTDVVDSPPSGRGRDTRRRVEVEVVVDNEERPVIDEPDYSVRYRRGHNVPPVAVQDVNRNTEGLISTFFRYQFERDGHSVPQTLRQQELVQSEAAREITRIGDQIYHRYNDRLDTCISGLDVSSSEEAYAAFANVASRMFQNGINWGRIVMLFMFGYKLAAHVVVSKSPMIFVIMKWMARYVREKLSRWIASHGGWEAICREYEASAKQCLAVLLFGVVVYAYIRWKK